MDFKLKKTHGKTWATLQSEDYIDDAFLKQVGELLVESVVYEAGKDFARQGNTRTPRGIPEGIPGTVEFFDSFYFKIKNHRSVELYSSWPFIEQITEGRRPYPMEWLTQQAGVSRVPMRQPDGTVLIRTTPATSQDAWIHPGFKKNNFVRRGYERARRKMKGLFEKQVQKVLRKTKVI